MSFTKLSLVAMYVTTSVGGFWWPIYSRKIPRADPSLQLTKNAPSSASIALARKFFIVVHSMCMGPLSGRGLWGVFFGSDDVSLR